MRYSEISGLRRCDVHFCDSYLKLFIEKSKTDVYREGNWIYISKIQSELCPVKNLLLYLDVAQLKNENSEQFIFRAITVTKKNPAGTLRSTGSSLSYTRMRDVLLEELESIGLKKKTLGYIVWNPEAPQPQLTVVCQIDCLNDMDDGNLKRQRMDISKMIWMLYYRYQHLSVYNNLSIRRYI